MLQKILQLTAEDYPEFLNLTVSALASCYASNDEDERPFSLKDLWDSVHTYIEKNTTNPRLLAFDSSELSKLMDMQRIGYARAWNDANKGRCSDEDIWKVTKEYVDAAAQHDVK